jgi:hypothetical protein
LLGARIEETCRRQNDDEARYLCSDHATRLPDRAVAQSHGPAFRNAP